jgi:hypothetical protein
VRLGQQEDQLSGDLGPIRPVEALAHRAAERPVANLDQAAGLANV